MEEHCFFREVRRRGRLFAVTAGILLMVGNLPAEEEPKSAAAWFARGRSHLANSRDPALLAARECFLRSEMLEPRGETEYHLGLLRETAPGELRDLLLAEYWYRLAAGRGYRQAEFRLGMLLYRQRAFFAARLLLKRFVAERDTAAVAAVRALDLHEAADSGDRMSVLRAKRDFAELHRAAANGDRAADLTLGRFFLLDQDCPGTGLRFLSRAARRGDPEAVRLIGGEPGGSEVTEEWARLSGKAFAAALVQNLAGRGFTGQDVLEDFKLLRQNLAGTGLTLLEETIFDFTDRGGDAFHAIAVRKGTGGKAEYYLLSRESASVRIDRLEPVDSILHTWLDAGYQMIAYRTAAGMVFSGGWPIGSYQGMYPGNDGREEVVYRDFERGDLKSSHLPALRAFLPALKRLLRENRRKEIAALVRYPLILEEDTLLEETIRNPEEFLLHFDRIFTGGRTRKILATPDGELFPTWEGAGVGAGLLWVVPGGDREEKTVRIGRFGSRLF